MKILITSIPLNDLLKDTLSNPDVAGTNDDIINTSSIKYEGYDIIIEDFNSTVLIDISNGRLVDRKYPKKDVGSVLINFINDSDPYFPINEIDAITTVFKNGANAVIYTKRPEEYKFIDALGNVWYEGSDKNELVHSIKKLYYWTSSSLRIRTMTIKNTSDIGSTFFEKEDFSLGKSFRYNPSDKYGWDYGRYCYTYETSFLVPQIEKFIELNKSVADKFELIKGRYFGNCSTRCAEMFPTAKINEDFVLVSKRNVPKSRLTPNDMVIVKSTGQWHGFDAMPSSRFTTKKVQPKIEYFGEDKPSVDTPIQCYLYMQKPDIKYMIHGHTYIEGAEMTKNYFPCGDLREVDEVLPLLKTYGALNLKNHGFLIYADTIENLEKIINTTNFIEREVGFEKVNI